MHSWWHLQAFRKAKEMAEAEAAVAESTGRPLPKYAGEADVKRVLDSNGPYDVLQVTISRESKFKTSLPELAEEVLYKFCGAPSGNETFYSLCRTYHSRKKLRVNLPELLIMDLTSLKSILVKYMQVCLAFILARWSSSLALIQD